MYRYIAIICFNLFFLTACFEEKQTHTQDTLDSKQKEEWPKNNISEPSTQKELSKEETKTNKDSFVNPFEPNDSPKFRREIKKDKKIFELNGREMTSNRTLVEEVYACPSMSGKLSLEICIDKSGNVTHLDIDLKNSTVLQDGCVKDYVNTLRGQLRFEKGEQDSICGLINVYMNRR